jgi:hypothetical protein
MARRPLPAAARSRESKPRLPTRVRGVRETGAATAHPATRATRATRRRSRARSLPSATRDSRVSIRWVTARPRGSASPSGAFAVSWSPTADATGRESRVCAVHRTPTGRPSLPTRPAHRAQETPVPNREPGSGTWVVVGWLPALRSSCWGAVGHRAGLRKDRMAVDHRTTARRVPEMAEQVSRTRRQIPRWLWPPTRDPLTVRASAPARQASRQASTRAAWPVTTRRTLVSAFRSR